MASETPDDGFHEIQLNGKQLVFLFMAATVVSVVIFLCGVLVGRGVRAERAAPTNEAANVTIEPTPQVLPEAAAPAASDPTTAAPPPTVDDLSYFNRLGKTNPPVEDLKAPASADAKVPATAGQAPATAGQAADAKVPATAGQAPATVRQAADAKASASARQAPPPVEKAPVAAPPPVRQPPQASTSADVKEPVVPPAPAGDGYVIQVAAMREHGDADAMARRLSSKGYSAFVLAPGGTAPTMYRVRVGKFKTKHDAETVAAKLQKEEQFKPWITR